MAGCSGCPFPPAEGQPKGGVGHRLGITPPPTKAGICTMYNTAENEKKEEEEERTFGAAERRSQVPEPRPWEDTFTPPFTTDQMTIA